jgi:UDP-N-acetylglucosamine 3-dehydrogenase
MKDCQSMLRVGVVGLGSIGSQHVRVIDQHPDLDLIGVTDLNGRGSTDRFEKLFCHSLDQLAKLEPDYVVIAIPTIHHVEVATYFMTRRIGVLIEKPLSNDFNSAQSLIPLQENCVARVGHIERFNSASIEAKRLIKSGALGQIISISTIRHSPLPNRIQDVGVILDLATHDIDLVQWLSESRYHECYSKTKTITLSNFESVFCSVGELKNGILITHSVNWLSPNKKRNVAILGEEGMLEVDLLKSEVILFKTTDNTVNYQALTNALGNRGNESTKLSFPIEEPLKLEHDEVINTFLSGHSSLATLEEAASVVNIASHLIQGLTYIDGN